MKTIKKFFALSLTLCAITSVAIAHPCKSDGEIESYAHPTMFGKKSHVTQSSEKTYVTGGKICKAKHSVTNKDEVYVTCSTKDILGKMQRAKGDKYFNHKGPTLRSEVATIFAEGLEVETPKNYKPYSDIDSSYWAKDWIYKVTEKGIMIGYPSGVFKPDQKITKAEVFATLAEIIKIDHSAYATPQYKNQTIKYIPRWAYDATNEVVASNLLDVVPNKKEVIDAEYLTKEQLAHLVIVLQENLTTLQANQPLKTCCEKQKTKVNAKMLDRISAKTSNIGDNFLATTTSSATVDGVEFPAGSTIRGEVVQVQRPGLKKQGFVTIKFKSIKCGETEKCLCKKRATACADDLVNPNFIARFFGAPFSMAGRTLGVVGRSCASIVTVAANGTEQIGDQFSDTVAETASLHAGRGVASFGNAFATVFYGVVDVVKVTASGIFGVVYELGDEIVYVFAPSHSNASSLNPNEELTLEF